MTKITLAALLALAACAGAPEPAPAPPVDPAVEHAPTALGPTPSWSPVKPRADLLLMNRGVDPNVPSPHAVGTRIPLAAPPTAREGLRMPDGTILAPLNGVVGDVTIALPEGRSATRVVAVEVVDDGVEWYVHEDGSYSTSIWAWRSDIGRWDPIGYHMAPAR